MSVIVVSDVHLGDESTIKHYDFSKFIEWIALLEKDGARSIKSGGKEIQISPPEKLILLGDILELWSPKDNDTKYTVQHAFEPFGKLANLRCEKIFVLGNHDEDISDSLEEFQIKSKEGNETIKKCSFKINSDFTIINRHYPENPYDENKGFLQLGKRKYFFLHGQQFDRLFLSVGPLANIPTYTAKISNAFSKIFPLDGWSVVALFAVFSAAYIILRTEPFLTLSVVTFLLSIPRLFTYLQDKVWANIKGFFTDKPKYRDVETIINKKYYVYNKDKTGDDVNFVFGHTHVPEIHLHKFEDGTQMLFVNSGSWVPEKDYTYNTFVYIDERGTYLFRWEVGGNVELLQADVV